MYPRHRPAGTGAAPAVGEDDVVGDARPRGVGQVGRVLEGLNVAGMLTNHRLARAITDAGWGELARQITCKQAWHRCELLIADRWFAPSKTCSACGTVRASLGLDERVYHCASCGHTADRDRNAAINLATWPTGVRRTDERRHGDTVLWFAERSDQSDRGAEPA